MCTSTISASGRVRRAMIRACSPLAAVCTAMPIFAHRSVRNFSAAGSSSTISTRGCRRLASSSAIESISMAVASVSVRSFVCACSCRRTGVHFAGTCASISSARHRLLLSDGGQERVDVGVDVSGRVVAGASRDDRVLEPRRRGAHMLESVKPRRSRRAMRDGAKIVQEGGRGRLAAQRRAQHGQPRDRGLQPLQIRRSVPP